MRLPKHDVTAYTDGSCDSRTRLGGWGAYIYYRGEDIELHGGHIDTTNNQMELMGALEALYFFPKKTSILVYSDSQYVVQGVTDWMLGWKKRGWCKSSGEEIINRELWEEMYALTRFHQTDFRWVKGHANNVGNCKADELANKGRLLVT